jgi:glycosyltransferase involved in cell wall biosynthesis
LQKSQKRLHVGYLIQQFFPEMGAGPARALELSQLWKAEGVETTVITAMPSRPFGRIHEPYRGKLFFAESWEGIRVLRSWLVASARHGLARTLINNASFVVTSAANVMLHARDIDVLIASAPPFFIHIAGAWLTRGKRIPLVLELRDLWPDYIVGMGVLKEGFATRSLFRLERMLLRRADRIVVVTESFKRRVASKGIDPALIHVIPNGVDTTAYTRSDESPPFPELARRDNDRFTVGYLGTFGLGQDLSRVLDAAKILEKAAPHVHFFFAGDGPDRARIESHAATLNLRNVTLKPAIQKNLTRAFYNACDACLVPLAAFPILQETVPSKIFEVMACERPVLGAFGGEARTIIERSGAGLVAEPGNAESIAAAVKRLAGLSRQETKEMGRKGREYVTTHYQRNKLAREYLAMLEGLRAEWQAKRPSR